MIIGSVYIPLSSMLNLTGTDLEILTIIRLPEAVGAIIIGIDLAIAGAVMQVVFRNPLADPYITGTGSGAVLGSIIGISIGFIYTQFNRFVILLQPVFGFFGAISSPIIIIFNFLPEANTNSSTGTLPIIISISLLQVRPPMAPKRSRNMENEDSLLARR